MIKNSKVTAKAVTKLRLLFLENKGKLPKNITDEKVIRYFNLINKLIKKYNKFKIPNHFGLELNFKLKKETSPKLVKVNNFDYIDFDSKIYKGIVNEKF